MDLRSSGRFLKDYKHGMDAIEDLHLLADPGLSPVISRVHFHLSEIRRKAEQSLEDHPGLTPVKNKIKEEFKFLVEEAALKIENCKQLILKDTDATLNLMQWGRLIETLPLAIRMIAKFPISGMLEVGYDNKALTIRTSLSGYEELGKIQSEVYRLSRDFFALKTLPTFQIENDNQVVFKFDFSHVEDLSYSVDLNKKRVLLSNTFSNYELPIEKIDLISNQTTLILSADGEFYYFESMKVDAIKKSIQNGAKPALFHFPFLFRPLSIIIPRKGEVAPLNGYYGTGCEKLLTDQDFGKSAKTALSLDIFSLLSK